MKEKPLPPPGDNTYLQSIHEDRKDRHDDRSTHRSSARPYSDSSKGRPAPPQETVVDTGHTRPEYTSRKDREHGKEAQGMHSKTLCLRILTSFQTVIRKEQWDTATLCPPSLSPLETKTKAVSRG